jgi:hypothetical protein
MASKALRGLTIEIGAETSDLNKALDKVDKRSKSLSSELGQINKALKLDPTNTELLAQKQKVLAEAISTTEDKLDTLKEAEKQVQEQFERGEVSEEQVRALRREIIETERKLNGYKNAAEETEKAIEELGKEAEDTGKEIEEQGRKTRETEKETEDMDDAANDLASGGLAALAAAAVGAVTAIVALAEESREYLVAMGKLDTAFQDASLSAEAATKTYEDLQSVVGETDQAVEASSLLAKMCTTEEELAEWTEILTGVYGVFGASIPVEGLAEAANETKRVGQVTGPLADALNWAAKEGETFGVTLKENIEFTELEKKELEGLTEAQLAEYEARKAQHDEIEEYNKSVEEAASAEDLFNIALSNCADEQERQQLITSTLTKLYGSAAVQYKKTNKEVIESNKATEKWNKATAKIGKTVEPVVTDIKNLGTALLEDAGEPLEDIADYIRNDVLPAITKTSKWVKQNGPLIKSTVVGVTTAMVAFKVATIATTVAQKGLKGAILETTVAQKALALAKSMTPWGWALTAITAVTVALLAYVKASEEARVPVDILTDEEKALATAADEAAEAFRAQRKATDETLGDITAEMVNTQKLANELRSLADASGKVQEEDQARANFILHELNNALGTEYEMVDGVIQKYAELEGSIDEVIQVKTANALLEASNEAYVNALQNEADAYDNMNLKLQEYEAQLESKKQAEAAYNEAFEAHKYAALTGNQSLITSSRDRVLKAKEDLEAEEGFLAEKKTAYDQSATDYYSHVKTIEEYTAAQTAALEGNYQTTLDLLTRKGGAYNAYSDKVDDETAKVLDTLQEEAVKAGIKAELTRSNFEKGVDGYTEEMVEEAEKGYQDALGEFSTAYADAEGVGENLADGMTKGAENKRSGLLAKARSLVAGFLSAARKEADSHSPSRKTMALGEDLGEGAEIGIESKNKDIEKAASKQMAGVLDAYSAQEVNAQRALRSLAEQQAARQTAGQMAAASSNGPMLEKILAAIENGQVITLDGDALVGATANKMDSALGRRRALASRGAI